MTNVGSLIRYRSEGIFSDKEWMKEGDGLLASARILRAAWLLKCRTFKRQLKVAMRPPGFGRSVTLIEGLPRSSVLLLGYAAEMYLKSGAVGAYSNCPEQMLKRDLQSRFGHNLLALAEEVEFPLSKKTKTQLQKLRDFIEGEARYPLDPKDGGYVQAWNKRTRAVQDGRSFKEYCRLVEQIRDHVSRINHDENDPAVFMSRGIGPDGFLTFRLGGNLRPRITYRPSSLLAAEGRTSPDDIKALLHPEEDAVILFYWDRAVKVEDGATRGKAKSYLHHPKQRDG